MSQSFACRKDDFLLGKSGHGGVVVNHVEASAQSVEDFLHFSNLTHFSWTSVKPSKPTLNLLTSQLTHRKLEEQTKPKGRLTDGAFDGLRDTKLCAYGQD